METSPNQRIGESANRRIGESANQLLSIQIPVSSIQHPASSIQLPASSFQHPASSIQHPASSIQHPAARNKNAPAPPGDESLTPAVPPRLNEFRISDCRFRIVSPRDQSEIGNRKSTMRSLVRRHHASAPDNGAQGRRRLLRLLAVRVATPEGFSTDWASPARTAPDSLHTRHPPTRFHHRLVRRV